MEKPKCNKIKQLNENLAIMGVSISEVVNLHKETLLKYFQEIYETVKNISLMNSNFEDDKEKVKQAMGTEEKRIKRQRE